MQKTSRFELRLLTSVVRSPFDRQDDASPFETRPPAGPGDPKDEPKHTKVIETPALYLVLEKKGSKLLLRSERDGAEGWAESEKLMPVEAAYDYFANQIRANSKDAFPFLMRGMLRYDKREFDAALADYDQAIKLDPKRAFAYIGRARIWNSKADYDKAIADCDQAMKLDPRDALAIKWERTRAQREKEKHDSANAEYRERLRRDPQSVDAFAKGDFEGKKNRTRPSRLHQRHSGRSRLGMGLDDSRYSLVQEGGVRQGDRRLLGRHRAWDEERLLVQSSGRRLGPEARV